MADYSAQITALETAAATGLLTVEQGPGERVTYQNMDMLLKALSYFKNAQAQGSAPGGVQYGSTLAVFGGGCE
jgi:hypothetical protein